MPNPSRRPNPRERKFIVGYVAVPIAAIAAREAGYSAKAAKEQGCRLLTRAHIKREIDRRLKAESTKLGITKEIICGRLWREANNPEATPGERIKALDRLGFYLGLGRININLEGDGSGPAHDRPALRELLKLMAPEQLSQFEQAMRALAEAEQALRRRKLIEAQPQPVTEVGDGEDR